jgi:hypothetical protein
MATKTNAREKFIQYVKDNGWIPDPTMTIRKLTGYDKSTETHVYGNVQSPFAFMTTNAPDGGTWHIYLDYSIKSFSWDRHDRISNTLKGIVVDYVDADGQDRRRIGILANIDNQSYDTYRKKALWHALRQEKPSGSASLIDAAKLLIKDPTTAVWLSFQKDHEEQLRLDAANAAARKEHMLRARPLPVTVSSDGWSSEWKKLTHRLKSVAGNIHDADGKADLVQLVTDLVIATEEIRSVLTDEAEQAVEANLHEVHAKLTVQDLEALKKFLQS